MSVSKIHVMAGGKSPKTHQHLGNRNGSPSVYITTCSREISSHGRRSTERNQPIRDEQGRDTAYDGTQRINNDMFMNEQSSDRGGVSVTS